MSIVRNCDFCGSENSSKLCSKCKTASYCGRECQMQHWRTHKIICKPEVTIDETPKDIALDSICFRGKELPEEFILFTDAIFTEKQFYYDVERIRMRDRLERIQRAVKNGIMSPSVGDLMIEQGVNQQYQDCLTLEPSDSLSRLEHKIGLLVVLSSLRSQIGGLTRDKSDIRKKEAIEVAMVERAVS